MQRKSFRLDEVHRGRPISVRHVVIAHGEVEYTAELHERFQQRGYCVHLARSGEQARFLARRFNAHLVVLEADLLPESGWLTCRKLVHEHPFSSVVLVLPMPSAEERAMARFVGASAIVDRLDGAAGVLEKVHEPDMSPWIA